MKVFTNGCFDILHVGHIELLKYCKTLGRVIVGVNSDVSVRRLKGLSRPVNGERERVSLLESLVFVDEVHIFDEDTPYQLIKKIQPDVIIKGGDYKIEDVVGKDLAEVRIFDLKDGFSTTNILAKIKERNHNALIDAEGIRASELYSKGWGHEEWLINNDLYCGKILHFNQNRKCSFHYHKLKTETFYVESGEVAIYHSWQDELSKAQKTLLKPGQIFHVPVGLRHQICALTEARVFEFSTFHSESDSYRVVKGD